MRLDRVGCWTLLAGLLSACSPPKPSVTAADLRGPKMVNPLPRPGFILTRADGRDFNFRDETRGTLTFLFFGYTNCPDVCPLHMQNVASVRDSLPPEIARLVKFVFVTTDPERDTPDRLRSWLAEFDSTFIGLTGSPAALEVARRSVGVMPPTKEGALAGGGYGVTHDGRLFAFTPDDSAHVFYLWGVKREDLLTDIPKLLDLYGR